VWRNNITDHHAGIYIERFLGETPCDKNDTYLSKKIDLETLKISLKNERWASTYNSWDANLCALNFHDTLQYHIDRSRVAPKRREHDRSRYRRLKPWMSHGVIVSIREKEKNFKLLCRFPSDQALRLKFKKYRNLIATLIKRLKTEYYSNRVSQFSTTNDCRKIWNVINEIINKKRKTMTISEINHSGATLTSSEHPELMATVFNKYFSSVGKTLAERIDSLQDEIIGVEERVEAKFPNFTCISQDVIIKIIKSMSGNTAPGFERLRNDCFWRSAGPYFICSLC
jgi:hypothetical protein